MPPKTKRRPTTQQRALPPYPFHTTVTNRPLKKKNKKPPYQVLIYSSLTSVPWMYSQRSYRKSTCNKANIIFR